MGIKPIPPLGNMTTTDPFGSPRTTKEGIKYPHAGEDLEAKIGTDVKAILDGVVVRSFHRKPKTEGAISYGEVIVLYHGERHGKNHDKTIYTYSLYGHLNKRLAKVDQTVTRKQVIAQSGNTGNVKEHLHLEVMESPYKITWTKTGNEMGNYFYGQHNIDPMAFLKKPFLKKLEPLTDAESAIVHSMVDWRFERGPRPALFVQAPPFREIMKRIRPNENIAGIKPPIFNLEFQNYFSKEFKKQHPSVALNVNGIKCGKIKSGITNYDLHIWS